MILLYIAIALLILMGVRQKREGYHSDYLSKESTNVIKGIFLLLIVISHSYFYIKKCGYDFSSVGDSYVPLFIIHLGQLVVVMFLFYSGYGIGESYKNKGSNYVKKMPTHRILTTLLNFDVAVVIFTLLCLFLSIPITTGQFLLSLLAWDSVGNSNWYIFCIIVCYIVSYIVLGITPPNGKHSKYLSVIFTFLVIIIVSFTLSIYKDSHWYNTIWAYGAGFAYSIYKDKIECFIQSRYCLTVVFLLLVFGTLYFLPFDYRSIRYNLLSIAFALLTVILSMKISVHSIPLSWVGRNLFPMYIYMRIPMMIQDNLYPEFTGNHPTLFILISLIITIIITHFYRFWKISLS